jgi:hypothetical protein
MAMVPCSRQPSSTHAVKAVHAMHIIPKGLPMRNWNGASEVSWVWVNVKQLHCKNAVTPACPWQAAPQDIYWWGASRLGYWRALRQYRTRVAGGCCETSLLHGYKIGNSTV